MFRLIRWIVNFFREWGWKRRKNRALKAAEKRFKARHDRKKELAALARRLPRLTKLQKKVLHPDSLFRRLDRRNRRLQRKYECFKKTARASRFGPSPYSYRLASTPSWIPSSPS